MPEQLSFAQARRRQGLRIVVLPDAARVEERLRRLAREPGRAIVVGKVACSLAELERELVREAQRAEACPAQASRFALQLALREAARDHSQGPYFAIRREPGYARALGDLWSALAQGLLAPADLLSLDVPERVRALGRTLQAAGEALSRAGLVDAHRALWLGLEFLEQRRKLPGFLANAAELVFEDILDWTPLRLRLLAALAALVPVRVRLPWSPGRQELTEALEPTLRAVESLTGPAPELELYDPAEGAPVLAPFLRRLFAGAGGDGALVGEGQPAEAPVSLVSCASPAAQAREVARRCAALLSQGVAPDGIAVAARTLAGGIAEELAAALDRASVPWRERRGRPALPAPPVRLALSLHELVEQQFPRDALVELLTSRLLWLAEGGDRLPPQALARWLRSAHVRDDANGGYAAALAALADRLRRKGEETHQIEETARRVQRVLSALRGLPARGSLREHGAALLDLLSRWGLLRRLRAPEAEDAGPELARAAAAALARDQAAARALEDACAGLARAGAQLGEVRVGGEEFAQLLVQSLSEASLPPGGARGGAVQLVELRELPGRAFEHVLVVGLLDGELPARPLADPLLSDEERRAVNRAARRPVFRVPVKEGETALLPPRQAEEPLLFHLALCAARRSVTLLWPRADAQGREALRSPFADEAARAAAAPVLVLPLAPIPAAADCATAGELLARAALDAFAEPAYRVTAPAGAAGARELAAAVAASPWARASAASRAPRRPSASACAPSWVRCRRAASRASSTGPRSRSPQAAFAFGAAKPASAHQLEDHATCEFRTLGKRLLRIEVDDRDDAELGQRERGRLAAPMPRAVLQAAPGRGTAAAAGDA